MGNERKANISTGDLYILMGRNYFKKFDKVVANVWRSLDRDAFYKFEAEYLSTGKVAKTMSAQRQLQHIEQKYKLDIKNKIKKCQESSSANKMVTQQKQIIDKIEKDTQKVMTKKEQQEVAKLVKDATNTRFGQLQENSAIQEFEKQTGKVVSMGQKRFLVNLFNVGGIDWFLVGKIDGMTQDNCVLEIKNRTKSLFGEVRSYEEPQIMTYMWMSKCHQGFLTEKLAKGEECQLGIIPVSYPDNYFEKKVLPSLQKFVKFFLIFIQDNDMKLWLMEGNESKLYSKFLETK